MDGESNRAQPPVSPTAPGVLPAEPRLSDRGVVPRLVDVAVDAGVQFTFFNDAVPGRFLLPEVMGGGAAWIDFDADGWLDLYLMNGRRLADLNAIDTEHTNRLYHNRGDGSFVQIGAQAGAADGGYGQGCAVGDYDADGFPDLFLANYGPNVLLHNNGDGTFEDVTQAAGTGDALWGSSAVWLDVDGDDDLDLYVVNYLDVTLANNQICDYDGVPGYCGPGKYDASPDRVYVNQGDGTFVESAAALGLTAPDGKGLALAAVDFDNDLRPEIYVANDMVPNFLFTRSRLPAAEGDASQRKMYANVAAAAGCAVSDMGQAEASMGIACGDFDGDALPDIFLTHYHSHKNTLYRNLGELVFQDDSRRTRIAATSFDTLGFGTLAFDYDRDGSLDLFIANGHVLGPAHTPNEMRPQLLHNDGRGRFDDISEQAGEYFRELWLGRGAAGADYDNDGDIDLAVTHLNRPLALLRNETESHRHFLGLWLQTRSRRSPTGGRVVVTAGSHSSVHAVVAGGSYLCSGDPRLLVGLGQHAGPVDVAVHWPSGRVDSFHDLDVDRYWRIFEGELAVW